MLTKKNLQEKNFVATPVKNKKFVKDYNLTTAKRIVLTNFFLY